LADNGRIVSVALQPVMPRRIFLSGKPFPKPSGSGETDPSLGFVLTEAADLFRGAVAPGHESIPARAVPQFARLYAGVPIECLHGDTLPHSGAKFPLPNNLNVNTKSF
jgi:hypothetical protein